MEGMDLAIMAPDGKVTVNGERLAAGACAPDAAWLSLDVMIHRTGEVFALEATGGKNLKWVQTANAGLDNPVYAQLAKTGTRLTNSDAQAISIAEYTLAYALQRFQDIDSRAANQREAKWRYSGFRELAGSTWLIIGFGNIGTEIAKRARAFDCEILGVRRSIQSDPLADEMGTMADLSEYLPQADVVVLACALNNETRGLADAKFFSSMKQDSLLINIARGALIDDDAMLAALADGPLDHAVLDAFVEEPLPAGHPFWGHDNVTVTAHTSNAGSGLMDRSDALFIENMGRWLRSEPLRNEVDLKALFG
jgi:phosphoglycerate dehydrogenase-like enzyme